MMPFLCQSDLVRLSLFSYKQKGKFEKKENQVKPRIRGENELGKERKTGEMRTKIAQKNIQKEEKEKRLGGKKGRGGEEECWSDSQKMKSHDKVLQIKRK